jgi:hypothetical protein
MSEHESPPGRDEDRVRRVLARDEGPGDDERFADIEAARDDDLTDRLIESNPAFRALVQKSKASPRKPFPTPREP